MKCPYCNADSRRVLDTKDIHEGEMIKRRRECQKCGKRWTTIETQVDVGVSLTKKAHRIILAYEKLKREVEGRDMLRNLSQTGQRDMGG